MSGDELFLIIGMTVATFLTRYPVMALLGRVELPEAALRGLRFVPVALLSAIIAPEIFIRDGAPALDAGNAYLVGGIIAFLTAWRWGNLLITILAGMGGFLLWRAIMAII